MIILASILALSGLALLAQPKLKPMRIKARRK